MSLPKTAVKNLKALAHHLNPVILTGIKESQRSFV